MTLKKGDTIEFGGYIWEVKKVNKKTVVVGNVHQYIFPQSKKILKSLLTKENKLR